VAALKQSSLVLTSKQAAQSYGTWNCPLAFLASSTNFSSAPFLNINRTILIENYLQARWMKISQNFIHMMLMAQWLLNTFAS
jgi:hypothetical protein